MDNSSRNKSGLSSRANNTNLFNFTPTTMNLIYNSPNVFPSPNGPFQLFPQNLTSSAPNLTPAAMPTNINQSTNQWPLSSFYAQPNWCHDVPNSMPWSNGACTSSNAFSNYPPAENPTGSSSTYLPAAQNAPYQYMNQPFLSAPSQPIIAPQENFNQNNKRQMNSLDDEPETNFDFESRRPIKKYISDDKVLEIFDRLHIREGDHYIVEDVADEIPNVNNSNYKHNVIIEVLENEDNERVLELSPELKNVFKQEGPSLTEKLLQNEKEKLSKALVLWQPSIRDSLLPSVSETTEDSDEKDSEVKIEELISDEDEEMLDCENDFVIEQLVDDDSLME